MIFAGSDPKAKDGFGCRALHYAAKNGHTDVVKELLFHRVDLNATDKHGNSALSLASSEGHLEVVEALVESDECFQASEDGKTALHHAAEHGRDEVVAFLLEGKTNPGAKDNRGKTALDYAKSKKHQGCVKLLEDRTPKREGNRGSDLASSSKSIPLDDTTTSL